MALVGFALLKNNRRKPAHRSRIKVSFVLLSVHGHRRVPMAQDWLGQRIFSLFENRIEVAFPSGDPFPNVGIVQLCLPTRTV